MENWVAKGVASEVNDFTIECYYWYTLILNMSWDFSSIPHLYFQVVHHTNGILHECTLCPKVLSNRAALKRHLTTHSTANSNTEYACPICHMSYPNQNILSNHLKTAHKNGSGKTPESMFICTKCGKNFREKDDFNSHLLDCQLT